MTDLLIFHLGNRRFAIAVAAIQEIVRAVTIVPLPEAPAIIEGVIDYRGTVTPVLDIRSRFGLPPEPLSIHQHLLLAHAHRVVAIRVDRVEQVFTLDPNGADAIDGGGPYITGAVRLADGLVLIHDLTTFLSAAEEDALDEALPDEDGSEGGDEGESNDKRVSGLPESGGELPDAGAGA